MVKINNTFKACALFAGVLYLLYGGRLVNEWRGSRKGWYSGDWPEEQPTPSYYGTARQPYDLRGGKPPYRPPTQTELAGGGGGGSGLF